jgi:hypothetical protein
MNIRRAIQIRIRSKTYGVEFQSDVNTDVSMNLGHRKEVDMGVASPRTG